MSRSLKPDVIIAETGLPDVDRWELCGWLKTNQLTTAIPVISLTARHGYDIPLRALDANISELLCKPCSPDRLQSAIKKVLGHNERRELQNQS